MPDYMFLLESRLSAEQRAAVVRVQELAAAEGANIYLVGGAVRDLISGMPIRDLDFVIEGNPFRIARELAKGGARILSQDERLRHVELIFAGDADGSIAAARNDIYHRPGSKPEIRWAAVTEDLRRRDFSLNAIAISLNLASRGLLLDPTNGLADLQKREVRALSIHSFTNQPVRLLRVLRYCVRMGFKMEPRTAEWFALALERGLHHSIPLEDVGREVRQLAREEKPAAILKSWEAHRLIGAVHAQLARRHPHYDALQRLVRARDDIVRAGCRPRLFAPVTHALLGRLKSRERSAALSRMRFRPPEKNAVVQLDAEAKKVVKILSSRHTAAPRDAFTFLEKVPLDLLAFIQAEFSNAKALGKVRNFLHKWKPLRLALPSAAVELEALGLPRGPKFDKVLEDLFQQQLLGKGRTPEDRTKRLRKLAGIKPPKKPKEEKKKGAAKAPQTAKKKPGKVEPQPTAAAAAETAQHAVSVGPAEPAGAAAQQRASAHALPAAKSSARPASKAAAPMQAKPAPAGKPAAAKPRPARARPGRSGASQRARPKDRAQAKPRPRKRR